MNKKLPFEGLKVVEFATVLAGPSVGMFFAELGAEVVKIENAKTKGDVTRGWKVKEEKAETTVSSYFASVNWGKQCLALDFHDPKDLETAYTFARQADVVIANFRPSSASAKKLDFESLKTLNPKLIYASLSAYGPDVEKPGYDVLLQAETGYISMTGTKDHQAKLPVAFVDLLAAHQLKEAILIALIKRDEVAAAQHVSVSLFDTAIASLANQGTNYLYTGAEPKPLGVEHPNIAPYGNIFLCADGKKVVAAVGSDKQFLELTHILDCRELASDPRFQTNAERVKYRNELSIRLSSAIATIKSDELLRECERKNVPMTALRSVGEALKDPKSKKLILKSDDKKSFGIRTVVFESNFFSTNSELLPPQEL